MTKITTVNDELKITKITGKQEKRGHSIKLEMFLSQKDIVKV